MTDSKPQSGRARKRLVQQGVRSLRARPGWDPARWTPDPDPLAGPRGALEEARRTSVEEEAATCPACLEERRRTQDPTGYCERHLAQALGLDPDR